MGAMNEGVILDSPYLDSLVCQSIIDRDGFVKYDTTADNLDRYRLDWVGRLPFDTVLLRDVETDNVWCNVHTKQKLISGLNVANREDVLATLLLFGKGYYFPCDYLRFDNLIREELVTPIEADYKEDPFGFDRDFTIVNKHLVMSQLSTRGLRVSEDEFDELVNFVGSWEERDALKIHQLALTDGARVTASYKRDPASGKLIKVRPTRLPEDVLLKSRATASVSYRLKLLVKSFEDLQVPLKTNIRISKVKGFKSRPAPAASSVEAALQAYKIYLSEITIIPRLTTISDVLRLREDKRVLSFRNKMLKWADILVAGDVKGEQQIRAEVQKANKELVKLGTHKVVSHIVLAVSLPVGIASLFYPPLAPLGLTLIPIGPALEYKSWRVRRKYDWFLLGK